MVKTVINISGVINSSSKANSAKNTVSNVESGIHSIKSGIDSKILNRNDINDRLNNVQNMLGQIEDDIARICAVINDSAIQYQNTENRVRSMGQNMGVLYARRATITGSKVHRPESNQGKNLDVFDESQKKYLAKMFKIFAELLSLKQETIEKRNELLLDFVNSPKKQIEDYYHEFTDFYEGLSEIRKQNWETIKQDAIEILLESGEQLKNIGNSIKNYIEHPEAFIPEKIDNKIVCGVYDNLLKTPTEEKIIEENAKHNREILESASFYTKGKMIENQSEIGDDTKLGWNDVCFSNGSIVWDDREIKSSMNYSGCGVIASYNAMVELERDKEEPDTDLVDIISYFEKDGAALRGLVGTSPYAIQRFFESKGYDTTVTTERNDAELNQLLRDNEVMVITVYNTGNNIASGMHTMCVTTDKDEDGEVKKLSLHNSSQIDENGNYAEAKYDNIEELFANYSGGDATIVSAIGIK